MAIFQRPFGQKKGNNPQTTTNDAMTNDSPIIEDVGTGGIQWITERHVACVFLLDTSGSMTANDAIGKLNAGLRTFKEQTVNDSSFDEHTKACIDVALVSFGPDVKVQQEFTAVSEMVPPTLTANGGTPMGAAIDKALDMIAAQKAMYNVLGTPYYRPWIFCITDGAPTENYATAAQRLKEMEDTHKVFGYCAGVGNFDHRMIASIFNTERIFELERLNFPALFEFIFRCWNQQYYYHGPAEPRVPVPPPENFHDFSDLEW